MSARLRTRLRDQRGYTMVELLAAMTVGTLVVLATFGLLDASLSLSRKVQDRVDNVQRGRSAMELVTQQLRSQVCLGPGVPAITQANDNSVTFHADLGDERPVPGQIAPPFAPSRRRLIYSAGTITEEVYRGTGNPPNVTFPATPTRTRRIISDVQPVPGVPVFRYYAFTASPVAPDLLQTTPLDPSPSSTAPNASARTVKIAVSFEALPSRGANRDVRTRFENYVYVRTSDPTDPDHSPQCI